jgi:arsenate reductase
MNQKVLFICTHNSARSQMAEGLLRTLYGNRYEAYSAGVEPLSVNPYAVEVMKELGIDLSTHRSKSIEEFQGMMFDYVVTVCNHAKETCPFFPGKRILHKEFDNPSSFDGSVEEILVMFRRIRDEIKDWIINVFG